MNKKVFLATIEWIKTNDDGKISIPFNESKYCPQISVDGQYIVNESSWSVFCLNFKMIAPNKTDSYIKYLNQNSAPDNLKTGSRIELYELGKIVAYGEIIGEIKINLNITACTK